MTRIANILVLPAALGILLCQGNRCMAVSADGTSSPESALRRCHIEPTTAGVLELLGQWRPTAENQARIARLVKQLGDKSYAARESASRQLADSGPVADAALREAAQSNDDLEVIVRADRLLDKSRQSSAEELLLAALQWLRQNPSSQATPALLELLAVVPDGCRDTTVEALWACTGPGDAKLLRAALDDRRPFVRAAAIPAYELAAGAESVPVLAPYLRDKDDATRLAAARALLDRRPRPAIAALVELLDATEPSIRLQAAWLLQQVSGVPTAHAPLADFAAAAAAWKKWSSAEAAQHPQPLGAKRLQMARYGTILLETFREEAASIGRAYHELEYETDVGGKAAVQGGMLRLDGNHAEGDQRLCALASRLVGASVFPRQFRIKATLGGEALDAGAWHVGISVGNVRLLFHPGTEGGQFRGERVDNHLPLTQSAAMPFAPAAGVLHEMTIDVARRDDGSVRFDATIVDGSKTGKRFQTSVTVSAQDVGPLARIGLERSGRTGGAALFGSFSIENAGLGEK